MSQSQLVWRCRRGVRELDVLMMRFLESEYPSLSNAEQLAFQRLLEVQDPTIMDWLFAKIVPDDAELLAIVQRLQALSGIATN